MKTISLINIQKPELLREVLSTVLRGQKEPWLLLTAELYQVTSATKNSDSDGVRLFTEIKQDPIAYFNIVNEDKITVLHADISGRHYNEDQAVIDVLRKIGDFVGGRIQNDNGEIV